MSRSGPRGLPSPVEQRAAEAFLQHFALPLCEGGAVHVGAPLGPRGLRALRGAVASGLDGTESGERFTVLRHRRMSELLLSCEPPRLLADPGAVLLLAAVHDLLFLLHPAAAGALLSRRLGRVAAHAARLASLASIGVAAGAPPAAELLAARHSLLAGLWTLGRDDVRVTFWAGRREFHGTAPPPRLLAWPSVRRVHEERWRVICYLQLLGEEGGRAAFEALLRASPLSDLLAPKRLDPPLDLLRHATLLLDRTLRRAVLAHYLEAGVHEIGGALGSALLRLLGHAAVARPPRRDLQAVLGFACELYLCAALDSSSGGASTVVSAPPGDGALRDLFGLVCALCLRWPKIALPGDVAADPGLGGKVRAHVEELARAVGPGRLDELIGLCARALGPDGGAGGLAPAAPTVV